MTRIDHAIYPTPFRQDTELSFSTAHFQGDKSATSLYGAYE